ncbi:MAG: Slp family lipoprotein [Ectothiorhodospiraceae bacterium]|nr:Slp family lipoprotein [Ectothiorhodospiraceae bacterium]
MTRIMIRTMTHINYVRFSLISLGLLTGLAGCASIPASLQLPLSNPPSLTSVQSDAAAHRDKRVRWGGRVISVENRADKTWLEIVAHPLHERDARPGLSAQSTGRFLAVVDGFLEPLQFGASGQVGQASGTSLREVTIVGKVQSLKTRQVGDFSYAYPVIKAEVMHIWPARYFRGRQYSTFDGYDPFWGGPLFPYYPAFHPLSHHPSHH